MKFMRKMSVETISVDERDADLIEDQTIRYSQKQQWQQQHPQVPQRPTVQWDNFLPVRSLKVLLVENDDSTRHAVSALLRNCSYEVTAVSDGLEAWKYLEDLANHVDLVLTEVATPCLSGIDLLSKIMSDKTCKNIPVVMMSSNDSMNIVFKSLSNGAVDFLVKPIRKNELKILWQHVWRKCHSSTGSGSESGIQAKKPAKSASVDGSNNNSDSNCEEGNGSTGLIYRNGSDNDSGTQSCSRKALEVLSSQPVSQWNDLADPPDSTCAQVIHFRPEARNSNWVSANATRMFQIEGDEHDVAMGKDLTLGAPTNTDLQLRNPSDEVLSKVSSSGVGKLIDLDTRKDEKKQGKDTVEHNKETAEDDIKHKDNEAKVSNTNVSISCGESAQNELPNDTLKVSNVNHMNPYDKKDTALGLQRPRDVGSSGTNAQERNILRQSDNSAFSRYTTNLKNNQALTGNAGSLSSVNDSLEAAKTESMECLQRKLSGTPNQGSNGSSNNFDSSTTNHVSNKPESPNNKSMSRSTVSVHNCYTSQPVQHGHCPSVQTMMPGIPDTAKIVATQVTNMQPPSQVKHHHHHRYHHHHHHVHSLQQQQLPLNSDDLSSRNSIDATPHCGISDKLEMAIEGNAANYESASGSTDGHRWQNGNGIVGIIEGTNVDSDSGAPSACVTGGGNRSAIDQERLAVREAALIKFRQKRKERCFEKKVRYQSRKKLAEQRPRVRGQFVRQQVDENKTKGESNGTDC